MYDKERVEDSLRVCEQIRKEKASNVLTTERLFSDMAKAIERAVACHPWDKYLNTISLDSLSKNNINSESAGKEDLIDEKTDVDIFGTFEVDKKEDGCENSLSNKIVSNIIMFAVCICVSFVFANLITRYVAHPTTVEGESMQPVLDDGDSIIIERVSYFFGAPKRFDIVVFPVETEEKQDEPVYYVKRIIGMPGDIVQIIDGQVYINGSQLKEDSYGKTDILDAGIVSNPVQLSDDEYFVLGDNRNMSSDSRYELVGMVKRSEISGKALCCIWPFKDLKKL